jgi:hypothetical protein
LKLDGRVGEDTFGFDRHINQKFYQSYEWKSIRDFVTIRDGGCDLGVAGYEIHGRIYIHHMNPVLLDDFEKKSGILLDPEYLVCASHNTHNAIHYGDEGLLINAPVARTKNDTCPWKTNAALGG